MLLDPFSEGLHYRFPKPRPSPLALPLLGCATLPLCASVSLFTEWGEQDQIHEIIEGVAWFNPPYAQSMAPHHAAVVSGSCYHT